MKDILGLLVLAWPLTLLVLIGITFLVIVPMAVRYAAKHGYSKWRWGVGAFLLVYLPIFWDWIPTVVAHKYYCEKEAGFWVYKTLDQWKAENPGVVEGLVEDKNTPMRRVGDDEYYTDTQILNQRFRWVTERQHPIFLLTVHGRKSEIVDSKNGEVVVRHVNFSSGGGRDSLKFWMNIESCPSGVENRNSLYSFVGTIVNMNKGEGK